MNAVTITAAEIVNELAEMFPTADPGLSTIDRIGRAKVTCKIALSILLKPVHIKYKRSIRRFLSHFNPMRKIITHMIATKWKHRKRIVP